jgi:hypothetical protein
MMVTGGKQLSNMVTETSLGKFKISWELSPAMVRPSLA